jgi:hypothetical protein
VLDVPSLAYQLFNRKIDKNSRIKTFRCRSLVIHRSSPGVVHYDGDPVQADKDINIRIVSKGLRVVVPTEEDEAEETNMLRKAHEKAQEKALEYVNGIKTLNEAVEAVLGNIYSKNQKIIRKLTRKE